MSIHVKNVSVEFPGIRALKGIELSFQDGRMHAVLGANGSGKSTVLKNVYRGLTPGSGKVILDGEDLLKMPYKKSAIKMAVVGQENEVPFDFSVEEIVAMGRSPHKKLFDFDNANDRKIVYHALEHLGMEDMAKRSYVNLSGGEKQRVIIARAVAQESDFLILDEPTNHLDISYQMQIFDFIKRLNVTVLSAIHDLNMAALYCDRVYALKKGKIIMQGTPEEIFTPENIFDIFGVRSSVVKNSVTGKMSITYLPAQVK